MAIAILIIGVTRKRYQTNKVPNITELRFNLGAGDYDFSIDYGGLSRTYKVHVPSSYSKKSPLPAVLNLHGGGGNSERQINVSQMNVTADKNGFIVVYPDGTGKKILGKLFGTWNSGACCGSAQSSDVDDVGFISQLITNIEGKFNIDKKRVFVTGYSNGSMMAMKLACEISDRIAAVATIASTQIIQNCLLTHPVPMIHFHGTKDQCHFYNGGKCGACFADFFNAIGVPMVKSEYTCESAAKDIEAWSILNGCNTDSKVVYQKGNTKCISFDKCSGNGEVEFCTMTDAGHIWPGGNSYAIDSCDNNSTGYVCRQWKNVIGADSNDINANDAMWEFFQKHPMP